VQSQPLVIGTRGSPLALAQAREVRRRLIEAHGLSEADVELRMIRTSGDRIKDKALREFGGKGLFTKEIEDALIAGDISMAVHSMKDMPTELPPGLQIACYLPREDVRDAFISSAAETLMALPAGAVLGTASLRRQAQVRLLRPDVRVVMFRGNVETRLRKLGTGEADATLLAAAGLKRLGMADRITGIVETDMMLPAVGQGAIGIEVRSEDDAVRALLAKLNDRPTQICVEAERAFLAHLDGSCRTPIAGLAELEGDQVTFRGQILRPDGSESYSTGRRGAAANATALAEEAAIELLSRAGDDFFEESLP